MLEALALCGYPPPVTAARHITDTARTTAADRHTYANDSSRRREHLHGTVISLNGTYTQSMKERGTANATFYMMVEEGPKSQR